MPTTAEASTMAELTPSLEADKQILKEMVEEVTTIVSQCRGTGLLAEDYTGLAKGTKERFIEGHPERRQEIELLFGLPEFFVNEARYQAQRAAEEAASKSLRQLELRERREKLSKQELAQRRELVERRRQHKGQRRELLEQLTEYTFTVTHYVAENAEDRGYLSEFWRSLGTISKAAGKGSRAFGYYKSGWLSEVAAYHLMEKFNMRPILATPKEDAFRGIDICGRIHRQELPVAFQIKTKREFGEVNFEVAGDDYTAYPIAESGSDGELKIYKAPANRDQAFAVKRVEIQLSHDSFDWVTGLPTESGVEQFGNQLEDLKRYLGVEGL